MAESVEVTRTGHCAVTGNRYEKLWLAQALSYGFSDLLLSILC